MKQQVAETKHIYIYVEKLFNRGQRKKSSEVQVTEITTP